MLLQVVKLKEGVETKNTPNGQEEKIWIEAEVTWGAKLLRNAGSLVASLTGFTYDDWVGLDPSTYSLSIEDPNFTFTTLQNNAAKVTVFSGGVTIDSRVFSLQRTGSVATFASPSAVKSWSEQFIDIGDKVVVEVITVTTNLTDGNVSVTAKWKENTTVLSSLAYTAPACPASQYPTPEKPYCGNH